MSRRRQVGFDAEFFATRAAAGDSVAPADAFRYALKGNLWGGAESASGPGSSLDQTRLVRDALPGIIARVGATTLLDLPCGDFHWMSKVDLPGVSYIGGDILPELIDANRECYGSPARRFEVLDITTSDLPRADLVLSRDCLVHFSFADIERALANIARAGIPWLLATTFPLEEANEDIVTGDWRPINLQQPPFSLPTPELVISEGCTEQDGLFADKALGLWSIDAA